mmetsp:Transcript_29463/g.44671  ORF Transcript_29463/g.44671 Transcript_29463/m.44671 type:complete len:262 (+) Transcript_29463:1529-2314(+)
MGIIRPSSSRINQTINTNQACIVASKILIITHNHSSTSKIHNSRFKAISSRIISQTTHSHSLHNSSSRLTSRTSCLRIRLRIRHNNSTTRLINISSRISHSRTKHFSSNRIICLTHSNLSRIIRLHSSSTSLLSRSSNFLSSSSNFPSSSSNLLNSNCSSSIRLCRSSSNLLNSSKSINRSSSLLSHGIPRNLSWTITLRISIWLLIRRQKSNNLRIRHQRQAANFHIRAIIHRSSRAILRRHSHSTLNRGVQTSWSSLAQ